MKTATRSFGAAGHGHAADGHDARDGHHDGHHDAHHDDHHDDHGHGHHGPHVPEGYDLLAKFCLLNAYLWVFYKFKEDKGQLFGYYKPWLHEHEHKHYHFVKDNEYAHPRLVEEDEHGDDEEHEEEEH